MLLLVRIIPGHFLLLGQAQCRTSFDLQRSMFPRCLGYYKVAAFKLWKYYKIITTTPSQEDRDCF